MGGPERAGLDELLRRDQVRLESKHTEEQIPVGIHEGPRQTRLEGADTLLAYQPLVCEATHRMGKQRGKQRGRSSFRFEMSSVLFVFLAHQPGLGITPNRACPSRSGQENLRASL